MTKEPESFDDPVNAPADGAPSDMLHTREAPFLTPEQMKMAKAPSATLRDSSAPGAEGNPSLGQQSLEHGFERIEEIGRGAFGRVWRARDRALGREVALKILERDQGISPDDRRRFVREARLLASLDHPNIVRIYSIDEVEGHLQLCLELLDGETLDGLVTSGGILSPSDAARIGVEVCRALAAIHALGLIHRDVKPSNIMRARGGRIVLLDFGLARSAGPPELTNSGIGGTPLLMSPEIIAGTGQSDPHADLYALGVTLYWLVTAKWPYEATSRSELMAKVEHETPVPLIDRRSDLPNRFNTIVARAMARRPEERFATACEMEAALQELLVEPERATRTVPLPPRHRLRWLLLCAAAALVLVAAYIGWQYRPIEVTARLCRLVDANTAAALTDGATGLVDGFTRKAPRPLESADRLRIGDELVIRLSLSRAAWVYVFNVDEKDAAFAEFPLNESLLRNPLPAGEHWLPGKGSDGKQLKWGINTLGGTEQFLVFVSPVRVDWLQAAWDSSPKPTSGKELSAFGFRDALRGAGIVATPDAAKDASHKARLLDQLNSAAASLPHDYGVKMLYLTARDAEQ